MSNKEKQVWGVFVGTKGDQLKTYNSKSGPFPPKSGTEGYIAIGWSAIGDMKLYRDNYPDYIEKFRIVYPFNSERMFKTKANMLWNFAFEMKGGDWVISPSSSSGFLLVGQIIKDYIADFYNQESFPRTGTIRNFRHLRKVKWLHIVPKKDSRYKKLHRIGQLTVTQPDISADELQRILNGET